MANNDRQAMIFDYLKVMGSVRVTDLASVFKVSEMTIRRDLIVLERASLIARQHGIAILTKSEDLTVQFTKRVSNNFILKHIISQRVATLIKSAKTIYIDGSSTAFSSIQFLPRNQMFTVYTNSLVAFNALSSMTNVTPFLIGGFLCEDHNTLDDVTSIEVAKHIYVDLTIFSCYGFSHEGIFNNATAGTKVKSIMIENSSSNVLVADSTKYLKRGLFSFCSWESISYLVSDSSVPSNLANILLAKGIKIIDH